MDSRNPALPIAPNGLTADSDEEDDVYDWKSRMTGMQDDSGAENTVTGSAFPQHTETGEDQNTNTPATGDTHSSDELQEDDQVRHPFYHYAAEKRDTYADAKLIYQRHRMDTKSEKDLAGSPMSLGRSFTMPSSLEGADTVLHRTPSTTSRQSRLSQRGTAPSGQQMDPPKESLSGLQIHSGLAADGHPDPSLAADAAARSHRHHPRLPHEFKDPLLAHEGVHGAGAGVGLGSGPGGMASSDESIVSEVEAICDKIKTLLDLRQKYMKISLQCPGVNPKDEETWEVYPPPPNPVWNEQKAREPTQDYIPPNSTSSSLYMADTKAQGSGSAGDGNRGAPGGSQAEPDRAPPSPTNSKKTRKPGQAIGEDFHINDCYIPPKDGNVRYEMDDGSVFQVYDEHDQPLVEVPTLRDYYIALDTILDLASDGPAKSFAYRRLQYLEGRYNLYTLLNEYQEVADTKKVPHRDFYNVRKVDTHVHHSACMNQKHLLRFIKSKMKRCPDEVVIDRDGKTLTLREVFESINLTAYDLSIDTLDMHAHTDSFHRFDKFNLKYNPIGQSRLREIFLKTDNFIKGRYLAEITREVICDLESSKYQMVEWRISIYGRSIDEWDKLAAWVVDNKLFSHNVRWLIQIPRLYALYKSLKSVDNFEGVLKNVFQPLFEVTQDPSTHPKLHIFLQRVIGFDSVDDESKVERRLYRKFPIPKDWNTKQNPPYGYWIYYLFANLTSLNAWRKKRGFNTFLLRPHCGEAGDTDHLAAAFLCCHSIAHGITLRKVPLIQYVFYLEQIGIAMSPLSNNALFLTYDRNPFISYYKKGLNVSLSTDDPLQFAFTKEPLIEEYSVAAQIYKLSNVEMCELAKHSVDQCGFELTLKQRWLGKYCYLPGVLGNDVAKCNVPDVREAFRHETLKAEHAFIAKYTQDYTHFNRCTPDFPDPSDPLTPIEEVYKGLESPRQFYSTFSNPVAPSAAANNSNSNNHHHHHQQQQSARWPRSRSSMTALDRSNTTNTSPTRPRTMSSALYSAASHPDTHISGQEPRAFPGVVHQRERRRSLRVSSSTSDMAAPDSMGASRTRSMSSSQHMEPALAKFRAREDSELSAQMEQSD
ncbi:AMP deaminase [Capronia coronata CBS 617.96]|uniref:AMP deaminase n=1 Tax=Capronia coronata CBS 617.96 TaxID=1182541 RepID=W9Y7D2_9EURO|nr:AMP deaminase [Capronia coronata CBS 617.96]EXJ88413.1 AMP deaminase [Capronia coronata CBS 617.96]